MVFESASLPPQQEAKNFEHMLEMPMTADRAYRPSDGSGGSGRETEPSTEMRRGRWRSWSSECARQPE
jgi:hypothetical protein